MRIAIVGTGISGMLSAYLLSREHEVVVFEAGSHIGGHTHTHRIEQDGESFDVDSGFIVYNERTYPNFVRLLDRLGVETQPTTMSFSVHCENTGLEYGSASPRAWFAQPGNLLRPRFVRMLAEIPRFNREALRSLARDADEVELGAYLAERAYSTDFVNRYIVPMGAAIWSTDPANMLRFPARTFLRFLDNHGLLSLTDQPQWRVVRGGSARYTERLTAPYRDRIRLDTPVERITRRNDGVLVESRNQPAERFDRVVVATHSDQALRLLADPTPAEREILGAIPYQPNHAVLHTDATLLPRRRAAWSAWNYRIPRTPGPVAVTYNMNILQGLRSRETFCVTLNGEDRIDPRRILRRVTYHHPLFTPDATAAQARCDEISGNGRTYFAGAYWGYGFHEDGVRSALAVARKLGIGLDGPASVIQLEDYRSRTETRRRQGGSVAS